MTLGAGVPDSVDRIAGRTGLSGDAVAVLMIVAGVLVIVFPKLLNYVVGIVLIVLGVLWLLTRMRDRQAAGPASPPATMQPPPPPPTGP